MVIEEALSCISDIKEGRVSGVKSVARRCLLALKRAMEDERFEKMKEDIIFSMLASDPGNPLLFNSLKRVLKAKKREEERRAVEEALDYLAKVNEKIAAHWRHVIRENSTVLTHYYSTNVKALLLKAYEKINFEVYVTESRPSLKGKLFARELMEEGVDVTLIADTAVNYFMPEIDAVIVGGTAVTRFGLIAPVGTSMIALAAHWNRVPFYCAVELMKISERVISRERRAEEIDREIKVRNPGYDLTREQLITAYITEEGVMKPEKFYSIASSKFW